MKRRLLGAAALAAAASLALAGQAPAASWIDPGEPTYVPTPAGQLDHYVYEIETRIGDEAPRVTRNEVWVSADRSHAFYTAGDGSLLTEEATEGHEWKVFYADANEIKVRRLKVAGRPPVHTLRSKAQILREHVDAGYLKVDGETTVDGRRALVLVDGPNDPDRHHNSERVVVDAESYVELSSHLDATGYRLESDESVQTVSKRRLVSFEAVDLAANADKLAFGDHPGAKVTHSGGPEEDTVASAARKAKAKKARRRGSRATSKRRAARSRRAAR